MPFPYGHKFPYTDCHDLNLDWVLEQIKAISHKVDNLENASNRYTDEQIALLRKDVMNDMQALKNDVAKQVTALTAEFERVYEDMQKDLAAMKFELKAGLDSITPRIKQALEEYDTYIKDYISSQLIDVKIVDYFTGQQVTIQQMFDTLAQMHVTNGLTYEELAARNYTYQEIIDICQNGNYSYQELVLNAKTIIPVK